MRATKTPGQQAAELIAKANELLANPDAAEFHEALRRGIIRLQAELDFWAEVAAAMAELEEDYEP